MFSIIERYIAREIFQTLIGVSLVLLLIFISNRLVRYLADAAAGDIPSNLIFTLLALKSISYFITLLPFALYLAILLVLGRLYRDNEMVAINATGMGIGKLYKIVILLALPLTLFAGWISLKVGPSTSATEYKIIDNAERKLEVTGLSAGRFREIRGGERIIYVEEISPDRKRTKNVFIYARLSNRDVVFSAAKARIEFNQIGERYLVLEDGYRYDGVPGKADYRMTRYKEHAFKLISKFKANARRKRDSVPTERLLISKNPRDQAELQWRISLPLSAFFLALFAIPIGKVNPRQGRYGKLAVAILVSVFYFALLSLAQTKVAKGELSPAIGLWWIHGLVFLLTLLLTARQLGFRWLGRRFLGRA